MSPAGAVAVMIAVAVIALGLMAWGWIRRSRRDRGVAVPLGDAVGETTFSAPALYVATTVHDAPLDRVVARPLAFRARADVTVTTSGLGLTLAGEPAVFIPAHALVGAGRATWTIDRVVETDGLVLVAWTDGSRTLDTYIRLTDDDPAAFVAAIDDISAPTITGATS